MIDTRKQFLHFLHILMLSRFMQWGSIWETIQGNLVMALYKPSVIGIIFAVKASWQAPPKEALDEILQIRERIKLSKEKADNITPVENPGYDVYWTRTRKMQIPQSEFRKIRKAPLPSSVSGREIWLFPGERMELRQIDILGYIGQLDSIPPSICMNLHRRYIDLLLN